jgi:hypothetical protein
MYHPEKEKKMAGQGNYIMVSTKQYIFAWEWNHREMLFWLIACRSISIKLSLAAGACLLRPQMDQVQISLTRSA